MNLIWYELTNGAWMLWHAGPVDHCASAARTLMAKGGGYVLALCSGGL